MIEFSMKPVCLSDWEMLDRALASTWRPTACDMAWLASQITSASCTAPCVRVVRVKPRRAVEGVVTVVHGTRASPIVVTLEAPGGGVA